MDFKRISDLTSNGNATIVITTIVTTLATKPSSMSLEQDIKQEKFTNEFQKMAVNLMFTSSWLSNNNAARFKAHGITPEQFNVLRILRGSHPKKMMLADTKPSWVWLTAPVQSPGKTAK